MSDRLKIDLATAHLPNAAQDEKLSAYQVLLIGAIQLAARLDGPAPQTTDEIRRRLEVIFEMVLAAGGFDRAGVFGLTLDDLCTELGLFGLQPYKRDEHAGNIG